MELSASIRVIRGIDFVQFSPACIADLQRGNGQINSFKEFCWEFYSLHPCPGSVFTASFLNLT
jgi:hypothetical protein